MENGVNSDSSAICIFFFDDELISFIEIRFPDVGVVAVVGG